MQITVNREPRKITGANLSTTLTELGFTSPAIATALNGVFVAAADRDTTTLRQNDKLEILSPMQGG